eukprot:TRINITY_DN15775_c0_g1_i6.p1 TRINITY_DN15775_c0_g1~~TRINITY_DN15775_c0_g1_i6.p1  ORF type:complete len:446 (-),score=118.07 TRINITY_DN15775_c0_g1_i6:552-1889(-)
MVGLQSEYGSNLVESEYMDMGGQAQEPPLAAPMEKAKPEESFPIINESRAQFVYEKEKLEHLGRGSFGDVWRAYDKTLKKDVAVKLLYTKERGFWVYANWDRASRDAMLEAELQRNKYECDLVKDMLQDARKDPKGASRICGCYREHVSDAEDKPHRPVFLVQELCGTSLQKYYFDNKKMSRSEQVAEARSLTAQMLEGVRFLNSLETPVVHHDLKPDNVNVMEDGAVKIIDWGGMVKGTKENMYKGTAFTKGYAPPEALSYEVSFYVSDDNKAHSYDTYAVALMYLDMLKPTDDYIRDRFYYRPLQQPFINQLIEKANGPQALKDLHKDIAVIEAALAPEAKNRPEPGYLRDLMRKTLGVHTPDVEEPPEVKCFQQNAEVEYWSVSHAKWVPCAVSSSTVNKEGKCIYDLVSLDKTYVVKKGAGMRMANAEWLRMANATEKPRH